MHGHFLCLFVYNGEARLGQTKRRRNSLYKVLSLRHVRKLIVGSNPELTVFLDSVVRAIPVLQGFTKMVNIKDQQTFLPHEVA